MKKGSLAEELYSESLKLSKLDLDSTSASQDQVADFQGDSFWDLSDHELEKSSDLDREWQRRREQFHTPEKKLQRKKDLMLALSSQFLLGTNGGLLRGVTGALALLPDSLKEKLTDTEERRTELQKLYESAHSLSTTDALKLFNDSVVAKKITAFSQNFTEASLR